MKRMDILQVVYFLITVVSSQLFRDNFEGKETYFPYHINENQQVILTTTDDNNFDDNNDNYDNKNIIQTKRNEIYNEPFQDRRSYKPAEKIEKTKKKASRKKQKLDKRKLSSKAKHVTKEKKNYKKTQMFVVDDASDYDDEPDEDPNIETSNENDSDLDDYEINDVTGDRRTINRNNNELIVNDDGENGEYVASNSDNADLRNVEEIEATKYENAVMSNQQGPPESFPSNPLAGNRRPGNQYSQYSPYNQLQIAPRLSLNNNAVPQVTRTNQVAAVPFLRLTNEQLNVVRQQLQLQQQQKDLQRRQQDLQLQQQKQQDLQRRQQRQKQQQQQRQDLQYDNALNGNEIGTTDTSSFGGDGNIMMSDSLKDGLSTPFIESNVMIRTNQLKGHYVPINEQKSSYKVQLPKQLEEGNQMGMIQSPSGSMLQKNINSEDKGAIDKSILKAITEEIKKDNKYTIPPSFAEAFKIYGDKSQLTPGLPFKGINITGNDLQVNAAKHENGIKGKVTATEENTIKSPLQNEESNVEENNIQVTQENNIQNIKVNENPDTQENNPQSLQEIKIQSLQEKEVKNMQENSNQNKAKFHQFSPVSLPDKIPDKQNEKDLNTVTDNIVNAQTFFRLGQSVLKKTAPTVNEGIDVQPSYSSLSPSEQHLISSIDNNVRKKLSPKSDEDKILLPTKEDALSDRTVAPSEQLLEMLARGKFKDPLSEEVLDKLSTFDPNQMYLHEAGLQSLTSKMPEKFAKIGSEYVPIHSIAVNMPQTTSKPFISEKQMMKAEVLMKTNPAYIGQNQQLLDASHFKTMQDLNNIGETIFPNHIVSVNEPKRLELKTPNIQPHNTNTNRIHYAPTTQAQLDLKRIQSMLTPSERKQALLLKHRHELALHKPPSSLIQKIIQHQNRIDATLKSFEDALSDTPKDRAKLNALSGEGKDGRTKYTQDPEGDAQCKSNPCFNAGTCTAQPDGYRCSCKIGWNGYNCERRSNCFPNPCHHGLCSPNIESYTCTCKLGYKGTQCDVIDRCHPNPCNNKGACTETSRDVLCECVPGFKGKLCQQEAHCLPINPCMNGGTCHEFYDHYRCNCPSDFHGQNCEAYITPTKPPPTIPIKHVGPQAIPPPDVLAEDAHTEVTEDDNKHTDEIISPGLANAINSGGPLVPHPVYVPESETVKFLEQGHIGDSFTPDEKGKLHKDEEDYKEQDSKTIEHENKSKENENKSIENENKSIEIDLPSKEIQSPQFREESKRKEKEPLSKETQPPSKESEPPSKETQPPSKTYMVEVKGRNDNQNIENVELTKSEDSELLKSSDNSNHHSINININDTRDLTSDDPEEILHSKTSANQNTETNTRDPKSDQLLEHGSLISEYSRDSSRDNQKSIPEEKNKDYFQLEEQHLKSTDEEVPRFDYLHLHEAHGNTKNQKSNQDYLHINEAKKEHSEINEIKDPTSSDEIKILKINDNTKYQKPNQDYLHKNEAKTEHSDANEIKDPTSNEEIKISTRETPPQSSNEIETMLSAHQLRNSVTRNETKTKSSTDNPQSKSDSDKESTTMKPELKPETLHSVTGSGRSEVVTLPNEIKTNNKDFTDHRNKDFTDHRESTYRKVNILTVANKAQYQLEHTNGNINLAKENAVDNTTLAKADQDDMKSAEHKAKQLYANIKAGIKNPAPMAGEKERANQAISNINTQIQQRIQQAKLSKNDKTYVKAEILSIPEQNNLYKNDKTSTKNDVLSIPEQATQQVNETVASIDTAKENADNITLPQTQARDPMQVVQEKAGLIYNGVQAGINQPIKASDQKELANQAISSINSQIQQRIQQAKLAKPYTKTIILPLTPNKPLHSNQQTQPYTKNIIVPIRQTTVQLKSQMNKKMQQAKQINNFWERSFSNQKDAYSAWRRKALINYHNRNPSKPLPNNTVSLSKNSLCPGFCKLYCDPWCIKIGCCKTTQDQMEMFQNIEKEHQSEVLPSCARCNENADCVNNRCKCKTGFHGNGFSCSINNCLLCHLDSDCVGERCVCRAGFYGDGYECKPDSKNGLHEKHDFKRAFCSKCHPKADCIGGGCFCKRGFYGNGNTCWPLPII